MAVGGLLALLDDLSVLMDDVAAMSKLAAKKTAGISGDDLAVNAQVLTGIDPKRELPIVWSVAKGSLLNKALLIPAALLLSFFAPWSITPILMLGGVFLCFEGAEKIMHKYHDKKGQAETAAHQAHLVAAAHRSEEDLLAVEKSKIDQAIRTDLILSAEIVAIALGTIVDQPIMTQIIVLTLVGVAITVVVYGLVGGLVKLDDIGLYLSKRANTAAAAFGRGLLAVIPGLMKTISVLGTAAMFMVGGGIILHGFHGIAESFSALTHNISSSATVRLLATLAFEIVTGLVIGVIAVLVYTPLAARFKKKRAF